MILKSHQHYTVMGERGRAGGRLLPPVPCNPGSRPLFSWLYPFFSISKYWPLLRNFPHFSLFSCRSLLSRLPYPSRPFFPRTSTNSWMDCGLSIFSLAEGKRGGGRGEGRVGKVVQGSKPPAPENLAFLAPLPFTLISYPQGFCDCEKLNIILLRNFPDFSRFHP